MRLKHLLLKTAFCCMACDGNIAEEEILLIKSYAQNNNMFEGIDVQTVINSYIEEVNTSGTAFFTSFLSELKASNLNDTDALNLIKVAIKMIESDNDVAYSEIKFFKSIRSCLSISDEVILTEMPDKEDYLLPDVTSSVIKEWDFLLKQIKVY